MTRYRRVGINSDDAVTINAQLDVTCGDVSYLDACCRIRGVGRTKLVRRLLDYVLQDRLVESVLDDGGVWDNADQSTRRPYRVGYEAPEREAPPEAAPAPFPHKPPSADAGPPAQPRAVLVHGPSTPGDRPSH